MLSFQRSWLLGPLAHDPVLKVETFKLGKIKDIGLKDMSEVTILVLHPCYIRGRSIDLPPVNWYAIRNPGI